MTLKVTVPNCKLTTGDRILKLLGRKRLPVIPRTSIFDSYRLSEPVDCLAVECRFQSFWSALFNGKEQRPESFMLGHAKRDF